MKTVAFWVFGWKLLAWLCLPLVVLWALWDDRRGDWLTKALQ